MTKQKDKIKKFPLILDTKYWSLTFDKEYLDKEYLDKEKLNPEDIIGTPIIILAKKINELIEAVNQLKESSSASQKKGKK